MDFDVSTWTSVASLIVSVIALFPRDKRQRTQDQQEALLAVSEAYHETAAYLTDRQSKGRERGREWGIAQKWHAAAILLERYDPNLADRLHVKSQFWHDGGTWDSKAIEEANIALTRIWQEVKELLGPDAGKR
jgi:hypothetical protein